nr:aminotransferase class III-fold pyridoxal phosphate-dependent enzyme [uncultured Rhodococcus sp.]
MTTLTLQSSLARFSQRFSRSAELAEAGTKLVPGGYSRNSFNFGPHTIYVDEGDGAYITTVEGHRLLDLNNNFTTNVLGHNPPTVQAALHRALDTGVSFGNPVEAEIELARMISDRIASIDKVKFSCSASESALTAVRIARAYTGRTKIAKFEGGYHGFTDTLQVSWHPSSAGDAGTDAHPTPLPDSAGIPQVDVANIVPLTQNDWEGTEAILRAQASDVACVILELESASGGLVTLDDDFVSRLRDLTTELGIVLIVDETVTLRAGVGGMQADYGVLPDLTIMGKIIGGGFPLGAVGGSAEVMSVLDSGLVSISGTHHGHKISVAAGIATLEQLDEAAFDRLNAMAARVLQELNEWSRARKSAFALYGRGISHLAYGFMNEPGLQVNTHRDHWRHLDGDRTQTISLELANRGFFPVARGDFSLSLAMSDDDVSAFTQVTKDIVHDIEG